MPTLYDEITSLENLQKAYHKALAGHSKYSRDALEFQRNETANLLELRRELLSKVYKFSGYYEFTVFEPKERIIHAPYFRDKIVQLAMHFVLLPIFMKGFISESYSCMPGRGTHRAVDQVQQNLRRASPDSYILKIDIKKFFYSIDRKILKTLYRKKIRDQDTLWLMDEITDSADAISPAGVPLGNTMSQLYSNVYMDRLDQYCKRYLGCKYYVRYADDIIIVLPSKTEANEIKNKCISFLKDKLNLEVNENKTQVFPLKNGVNAFGFKIYSTHRLLRDDSKRRIKRKIKVMPHLIEEGLLTEHTANQMLASWQGHAKHGDSYHFIQSLLARNPHVQLDKEGVLKIDESKI